jgi:hypothetical protein
VGTSILDSTHVPTTKPKLRNSPSVLVTLKALLVIQQKLNILSFAKKIMPCVYLVQKSSKNDKSQKPFVIYLT